MPRSRAAFSAGRPNASQPIGCSTAKPARPLVARHHVAQRVVAHMPHVDLAAGVGEHLQHVVFRPAVRAARPRRGSSRARPRRAASAARPRGNRSAGRRPRRRRRDLAFGRGIAASSWSCGSSGSSAAIRRSLYPPNRRLSATAGARPVGAAALADSAADWARSSRACASTMFSIRRLRRVDRRIDPLAVLLHLAEQRHPDAVGAQLPAQDIGGRLEPFVGRRGGVYQSVMITPPNGSAEASGMNFSVSSAPRHR